MTQAVNYVANQKGNQDALNLLRHFLDTLDQWVEEATKNMKISAFMDKVAQETSEKTGLSFLDVRKEVAHMSGTDRETRKWVKYAMGSLHVSGTP